MINTERQAKSFLERIAQLRERAQTAEARAQELELASRGHILRIQAAQARVEELKNEIDRLQTVICAEQDRGDIIEAATLERCAQKAQSNPDIAAAIRALKRTKEPTP